MNSRRSEPWDPFIFWSQHFLTKSVYGLHGAKLEKKKHLLNKLCVLCCVSRLKSFMNIQWAKLIKKKMRYFLGPATGIGFFGGEDKTCSPGTMADHSKSNCSPSLFFAAPDTPYKWTISNPSCKDSRQKGSWMDLTFAIDYIFITPFPKEKDVFLSKPYLSRRQVSILP